MPIYGIITDPEIGSYSHKTAYVPVSLAENFAHHFGGT